MGYRPSISINGALELLKRAEIQIRESTSGQSRINEPDIFHSIQK